MKALSVRQPWAWLIVHGGKDIENRTWKTAYRGPVLIHAAKKVDLTAYNSLADEGIGLPPMEELHTGGIIGRVEIVDCVSISPSGWFSGPYGLVLANPAALTFHPCRGQLFFFQPGLPETW